MGEPKKLEVKPNKKVKIRNINKYIYLWWCGQEKQNKNRRGGWHKICLAELFAIMRNIILILV